MASRRTTVGTKPRTRKTKTSSAPARRRSPAARRRTLPAPVTAASGDAPNVDAAAMAPPVPQAAVPAVPPGPGPGVDLFTLPLPSIISVTWSWLWRSMICAAVLLFIAFVLAFFMGILIGVACVALHTSVADHQRSIRMLGYAISLLCSAAGLPFFIRWMTTRNIGRFRLTLSELSPRADAGPRAAKDGPDQEAAR